MKQGATINIILSPRSNDERRILYINVRFGRDNKRVYSLGGTLKLLAGEFANKSKKVTKAAFDEVEPQFLKAKKIISELGDDFTFEDFSKAYYDQNYGKKKKGLGAKNILLTDLMEEYIETHPLAYNTKTSYRSAPRWVDHMIPNAKLRDILKEGFFDKFENFIIQKSAENGKVTKQITISCHKRSLRAILHYAAEKKYITKDEIPKIKMHTSEGRNRAMTDEEFDKLIDYQPVNYNENLGKDMFILSYLMDGMNLSDLFRIKNKDMTDETILFERWKIRNSKRVGKMLEPVLVDEAKAIFNKYGTIDPNQPSEYVLDFLKGIPEDDTDQQDKKKYLVNALINDGLASICKKLGIWKVTYYCARHTFATHMINDETPIAVISKLVGHSDIHMTMNYVDRLTTTTKDKVTESKLSRIRKIKQE